MTLRHAFILLSALTLAACSDDDSPSGPSGSIATIRSTTSFGFCIGYCNTSLEITSAGMVFVEEPRTADPAYPTKRTTAPITAAEWQALLDAVDRPKLEALPDTIGCPDCADGGAESLQVNGSDWQEKITFEYNKPVDGVQSLLDRVRALRQRFRN